MFPVTRGRPSRTATAAIRQVKAGRFSTVVNCDKNDKLKDEDLAKVYKNHNDFDNDCSIYWNLARPH